MTSTNQSIDLATVGERDMRASVVGLSLDQLIATQPNVESMLAYIRQCIGDKIRERRAELNIGLEEMRELSKGQIDSAGLSRLERGRLWSDDLARHALIILNREQTKRAKAAAKTVGKARG